MGGRMWGVVVAALMIAASPLIAQEEEPATAPDTSGNRGVEANEEYDLDIAEKHIELGDLDAGLALSFSDGERLSLSVGAAISGEDVDIWLRNVQGHLIFRGTLRPLLERIGRGGDPGSDPE